MCDVWCVSPSLMNVAVWSKASRGGGALKQRWDSEVHKTNRWRHDDVRESHIALYLMNFEMISQNNLSYHIWNIRLPKRGGKTLNKGCWSLSMPLLCFVIKWIISCDTWSENKRATSFLHTMFFYLHINVSYPLKYFD